MAFTTRQGLFCAAEVEVELNWKAGHGAGQWRWYIDGDGFGGGGLSLGGVRIERYRILGLIHAWPRPTVSGFSMN